MQNFRQTIGPFIVEFLPSESLYRIYEENAVVKESASWESIYKYVTTPKKEKKEKFDRIKCYKASYGESFIEVQITSLAEIDRWNKSQSVWIVDAKGIREKISIDNLVAYTEENKSIIETIKNIEADISNKKIAIGENRNLLTKVQLPRA